VTIDKLVDKWAGKLTVKLAGKLAGYIGPAAGLRKKLKGIQIWRH